MSITHTVDILDSFSRTFHAPNASQYLMFSLQVELISYVAVKLFQLLVCTVNSGMKCLVLGGVAGSA